MRSLIRRFPQNSACVAIRNAYARTSGKYDPQIFADFRRWGTEKRGSVSVSMERVIRRGKFVDKMTTIRKPPECPDVRMTLEFFRKGIHSSLPILTRRSSRRGAVAFSAWLLGWAGPRLRSLPFGIFRVTVSNQSSLLQESPQPRKHPPLCASAPLRLCASAPLREFSPSGAAVPSAMPRWAFRTASP